MYISEQNNKVSISRLIYNKKKKHNIEWRRKWKKIPKIKLLYCILALKFSYSFIPSFFVISLHNTNSFFISYFFLCWLHVHESLEIIFRFCSSCFFLFWSMTTIPGKYKDSTTNDNKHNRIAQNWKEYFCSMEI